MLLLWLWYYDWLGTATLSKGRPFDLICWMDSIDLQCKFTTVTIDILWVSHGIPIHDVLIGLSQRFVAGHATAAADSWGIRGTKARIMMQNDVDMFLSSRNQKFDVVLWCFMIFHVVTVVEANAGMLLWSSVYENSLTGHLAVDLSWAPCLRRSSFPSPFSFPNGIGTPKTSVPRLGHPMADQVNHLEIGNLSWFIMI